MSLIRPTLPVADGVGEAVGAVVVQSRRVGEGATAERDRAVGGLGRVRHRQGVLIRVTVVAQDVDGGGVGSWICSRLRNDRRLQTTSP